MTSLKKTLDVLIDVLFDATPSGVSKTLLKSAVDAIEPVARTWEELYVDAFQSAVEDMRPQLEKYAGPDGEVGLNEGRLLKALQGELSVHDLAESDLRSDAFLNELAERLLALDALYIGGSQLSEADTRQLVRNLVRQHAPAQFKATVEQNEAAFRQAIRREALKTSAGLDSVQAYLAEHFELVLVGLAAVREDVAEHRAETHDEHAAIREDIADMPRRVADEMIARGAVDLAPPKPYSTFLSYAWDDNKPFVEKLCADLRAAGVTVWWDETDLESRGNTLRKEIKEGIQQAARFVPVIGPVAAQKAATPGTNINLEWDYARQLCKAVTPVLRLGEPSLIPPDFACNLWFDFRDDAEYEIRFSQLLDRLREAPALPGTLRGGPWRAVPVRALPRMELVVEIRDKLQADDPLPVGSSGTAGVVLVHGPAGLGKSILATLVAYDCEVRRGFPDGVVWVEVGHGTTAEELRIRIGAAFGVQAEQMQSPADLTALLYDKDCLLILDDAWEQTPVEQCLVPGPDLRYLVTSRRARLLNLPEENYVRLGYLSDQEGAELIARRLGFEVAAPDGDEEPDWPDRAVHKKIAGELDGHLQAIALCAARLASRDATSPADLLAELKDGDSALLDALRRDIEDESREGNFLRSFTLSYEALSPEMRRRFRLLGAFAGGGSFEAEAASAVWEEENGSRALRYLVDRALVDQAKQDRYMLHALSHAAARVLLERADEREEAAQRHFAYYFSLHGDHAVNNNEDRHPLIDADWENVLTVLSWGVKHAKREAIDLAWAVEHYVTLRHSRQDKEDLLSVVQQAAAAIGYHAGEANALRGLGHAARITNQYEKATDLYKRALFLYQSIDDKLGQANILKALGHVAWMRAEYAEASLFYQSALPIFVTVGSLRGQGHTLKGLGHVAIRRNEYKQAVGFYRRALYAFRAADSSLGRGSAIRGLAKVAFAVNRYELAQRFYCRALSLYRQVGSRLGQAHTFLGLGDVALKRTDYERAMDFYERARSLYEDRKNDLGGATVDVRNGDVLQAQARWQESMECYERAIRTMRKIGSVFEEAGARERTVIPLAMLGRVEEAIDVALQVKVLYEGIGAGSPHDTVSTLRQVRREIDPERFDPAWQTVTGEPVPYWLK